MGERRGNCCCFFRNTHCIRRLGEVAGSLAGGLANRLTVGDRIHANTRPMYYSIVIGAAVVAFLAALELFLKYGSSDEGHVPSR